MSHGRLPGLLVLAVVLVGTVSGDDHILDPCPDIQGLRQSPIDLDLCAESRLNAQGPLKFTDFDTPPLTMALTNTGSYVAADLVWDVGSHQLPQISGGDLPGTFTPLRLALIWGANRTSGSEHSVNGRFFAAELVIQCRNVLYTTNEQASQNVDGLAGISILLEYQDVRFASRRGLGLLAPEFEHIRDAGTAVLISDPPSLRQLMPSNLRRFAVYDGSGTGLGGCPEAVTWVVLLTPVPVVERELQELRQLKDADGMLLERSQSRPQQPLNGRELRTRGVMPLCV